MRGGDSFKDKDTVAALANLDINVLTNVVDGEYGKANPDYKALARILNQQKEKEKGNDFFLQMLEGAFKALADLAQTDDAKKEN